MSRRSKRSPVETDPSRPHLRTEDERLFEPQPVQERQAFTHTDPWRVLRITGEFVEGFDGVQSTLLVRDDLLDSVEDIARELSAMMMMMISGILIAIVNYYSNISSSR